MVAGFVFHHVVDENKLNMNPHKHTPDNEKGSLTTQTRQLKHSHNYKYSMIGVSSAFSKFVDI